MENQAQPKASDGADGEYWRSRMAAQINGLIDIVAGDEARIRDMTAKYEAQYHDMTAKYAARIRELSAELETHVRLNHEMRRQFSDFVVTARRLRLVDRLLALLPVAIRNRIRQRQINRDADFLRQSGRFDEAWYLSVYRDVADSKQDPIVHFLTSGTFEGRQPRADFNPIAYLMSNPDLACNGMNPFVHFVRAGAAPGQAKP